MCMSLNVAINKCINVCFVHLYWIAMSSLQVRLYLRTELWELFSRLYTLPEPMH